MRAPSPNGQGCYVQVWNLDNKAKLKHIDFTETIILMTWVNNNILAMVTPTKVYHSDLNSQAVSTVAFDRAGELASPNCQIIGYKISSQGNWAALYGISSPDQR